MIAHEVEHLTRRLAPVWVGGGGTVGLLDRWGCHVGFGCGSLPARGGLMVGWNRVIGAPNGSAKEIWSGRLKNGGVSRQG